MSLYSTKLDQLTLAGDFGLRLWPATLAGDFGPGLWPATLACDYGRRLWPATLARDFGPGLWPTTLAGDFGRGLWPTSLARDFGRRLWPATFRLFNQPVLFLGFKFRFLYCAIVFCIVRLCWAVLRKKSLYQYFIKIKNRLKIAAAGQIYKFDKSAAEFCQILYKKGRKGAELLRTLFFFSFSL